MACFPKRVTTILQSAKGTAYICDMQGSKCTLSLFNFLFNFMIVNERRADGLGNGIAPTVNQVPVHQDAIVANWGNGGAFRDFYSERQRELVANCKNPEARQKLLENMTHR